MDTATRTRWISLVISLPGRRGTARMRIWRALKSLGAAALRDGVYLLPDSATSRAAFEEQAAAIRVAGGAAHVLPLEQMTRAQDETFRALFDRSSEYAALVETLRKQRTGVPRRRIKTAARAMRHMRRDYEALRAIDFFPGPAAEEAGQLLTEVETLLASAESPGEPHTRDGVIQRRAARDYHGRTWVSRARPWVDRLASAWLIRRFIDPKARILWLKDVKRRPVRSLGFDFDGADFTHVGTRVSFETLAASFDLERDAALMRFGALVHYLDVGGTPVPEADGLAAILAGARDRHGNDKTLFAEACRVFDHLYTHYSRG